jgi:hypothetical protein
VADDLSWLAPFEQDDFTTSCAPVFGIIAGTGNAAKVVDKHTLHVSLMDGSLAMELTAMIAIWQH